MFHSTSYYIIYYIHYLFNRFFKTFSFWYCMYYISYFWFHIFARIWPDQKAIWLWILIFCYHIFVFFFFKKKFIFVKIKIRITYLFICLFVCLAWFFMNNSFRIYSLNFLLIQLNTFNIHFIQVIRSMHTCKTLRPAEFWWLAAKCNVHAYNV